MFEDKINNINNSPGLKKRIQRNAIIVFLEREHHFPMRRLMRKEKFYQISNGIFKLKVDEKVIIENVNRELIEVVHELIKEEILKIDHYGWLIPGNRFKKRYPEERDRDPGYDFIQ